MDRYGLKPSPERKVLSVTQLNREARRLLETGLPMTWVEGELSNIARPASGHWYFTLKDKGAQIRCAMFRNRNQYAQIEPRDGMAVVVRGRVSLYEARGDYQLIAENIQDAGVGALQRQFEALKLKLAQEGLFSDDHKRPLPGMPSRIGVITSPTGAAVKDILNVLNRRFPGIPVRIYPVSVQGDKAAGQIVNALKLADSRNDCDVLILARGGGSIEDLWPFNEEAVARAIHACGIPIVSAVGHETDITIADFVSDLRAPTPSAAAELVVPDAEDWVLRLQSLRRRLLRSLESRLEDARENLLWLAGRHNQVRPDRQIAQHLLRLDDIEGRLKALINIQLARRAAQLDRLSSRLQARAPQQALMRSAASLDKTSRQLNQAITSQLNLATSRLNLASAKLNSVGPQATLARGYAIVMQGEQVVTDSDSLAAKDDITVRLARGSADATVTKVFKPRGKK
ncbi:MAG: exodeoxyribonuclease VII large subunit [Gammaproteobacteria bacterium]